MTQEQHQEKRQTEGTFTYEQDSKRFHRFRIEGNGGMVGTIYFPKSNEGIPKRIVLEINERNAQ